MRATTQHGSLGLAGSCLALSLMFAPAVIGAAEPAESGHAAPVKPRIGRIFFSPAERRSAHGAALGATSSAVAPSERFTVNGAVNSSTRSRAVWINGVPIEDSAAKKSAWTDRNGNVWFHTDALGTRLIRPGQSIDRRGAIEDLLPAGSVTRR